MSTADEARKAARKAADKAFTAACFAAKIGAEAEHEWLLSKILAKDAAAAARLAWHILEARES